MTTIRQSFSGARTLVELMVALAISLVILLLIMTLFISNKQLDSFSDNRAKMEEDGRLALNLMAFHLRMASFGELQHATLHGKHSSVRTNLLANFGDNVYSGGIEACSGGFQAPSKVQYVCNNSNKSDAFLVRYIVNKNNSNLNASGVPTDCLGEAVIRTPPVVENRFYIQTNLTTGNKELYCQGSGKTSNAELSFKSSPQPVAENINEMKLSFGYAQQQDLPSADSYLTAQQIISNAIEDSDKEATDFSPKAIIDRKWKNVVSVNICLIVRSNHDMENLAQSYVNCSGENISIKDRRMYQKFQSVIALRNRIAGS